MVAIQLHCRALSSASVPMDQQTMNSSSGCLSCLLPKAVPAWYSPILLLCLPLSSLAAILVTRFFLSRPFKYFFSTGFNWHDMNITIMICSRNSLLRIVPTAVSCS